MIRFVSKRDHNVKALPTLDDLRYYLNGADTVAVDIETTGLDPYLNDILMVIVGVPGAEDYVTKFVIDATSIDITPLHELLKDKLVIGHNFKFDYKFLKARGVELRNVWDTMVVDQRLFMGFSFREGVSYGLAATLERHLNKVLPQPKSTREEFLTMNLKSTFEQRHLEYAAGDVQYLFDIRRSQQARIAKYEMGFLIEIENKCVPILGDMELEGLHFNKDRWYDRLDKDEFRLQVIEQEMDDELRRIAQDNPKLLGGKFTKQRTHWKAYQLNAFDQPRRIDGENKGNVNYGSSTQVLEIFNRLEVEPPKKRDGKATMGKDQVEQWILENKDSILYPFMLKYRERSKLQKAIQAYGENFNGYINKKTGKIHTAFHQCKTRTGRLSCGDSKQGKPNFQQMQRSDEYRNCFYTDPGYKIVGCDLGGAELVILAANSGDRKLFELVKGDMHSYLATQCWRAIYRHRGDFELAETFVVSKEENKDKRQVQKNVNYGLSYGASAMRIAETLGVSVEEGEIVEETIKDELPEAFGYLDSKAEEGLRQGYIILCERTKSRRWFPEVVDAKRKDARLSKGEVGRVERLCKNSGIQGTQADMLKEAMVEIDQFIRDNQLDAKMLLQIHDELQIAYREELDDWFPAMVAEIMTTVANRYLIEGIEMSADFDTGTVWKK